MKGKGSTKRPEAVPSHIKDLIPREANPRKRTERSLHMIVESLQKVGAARSIVIDEDNNILAGNGTVEGAGEIDLTKVKVVESDGSTIIAVRRRGLTEEQKRALVMYDNRASELSEWDRDQVAADLASGHDLTPFFFESELKAFGGNGGPGAKEGKTDPDEVPPERPTSIVRGDLFELGRHRLLCGDCTSREDIERLRGEVSRFDLMITDPPYCSGGFQESGRAAGSVGTRAKDRHVTNDTLSTRGYMALLRKATELADPSMFYVFTDWRMWVNLFDVAESSGFGVRNMIVWDKGTPGMGVGWRSQHELIMFGTKSKYKFDNHKAQGNVVSAQRTGNVHHTTEKPVEILDKMLYVTEVEEVVDPFLGSGTTVIAAERAGRRCCGMELEPKYCQVTIDRWEAFTGQKARRT